MATIKTEYLGNLRTRAKHVKSANALITDAPIDNHGKGEAFSPTDLLATSLASCMFTIMGIAADANGIDVVGIKADTDKIMESNPRRVSRLDIQITFPEGKEYSEEQRSILEKAALSCPVYQSLSEKMEKNISFNW